MWVEYIVGAYSSLFLAPIMYLTHPGVYLPWREPKVEGAVVPPPPQLPFVQCTTIRMLLARNKSHYIGTSEKIWDCSRDDLKLSKILELLPQIGCLKKKYQQKRSGDMTSYQTA